AVLPFRDLLHGEAPMRRASIVRIGLVVAVFVMAGCSRNKGKLEGTKWTSLPASVKGQILNVGALEIEFTSDKKVVYISGSMRYTGTYTLGFGSQVTLILDQPLGGETRHVEKIVIDGDRMMMTSRDGTYLTFSRVK